MAPPPRRPPLTPHFASSPLQVPACILSSLLTAAVRGELPPARGRRCVVGVSQARGRVVVGELSPLLKYSEEKPEAAAEADAKKEQ